jgi:EAL domain-containing protein (putative c-di-GMP-specific phosphodiesterase class I)/FixJ family two-component response regulator
VASVQNILVIDDDGDMCEFVCAKAQAMGFRCTTTTDAKTLLENLSADTTLILMDLMMPEMDGIQLLRQLGEQKCNAGIVLMSAAGNSTMESAGRLAQLLGLTLAGQLQKPFKIEKLEELLQFLPDTQAARAVHTGKRFVIQKEELQNAIRDNEFVVHYQPQIDIATGRVIGVEALVRWQHPKRGLIFPDSFIRLMEKFRMIDDLGWIVANRGLSEVGQFATGDGKAFTLSLNASVNSLGDLNFPDILVSIARKHGVSPANVTIEITETGLIKELAKTLDILTRLRMKQFNLSIDDFGTGYAMMQQFKTIPATELKIDKSFVREVVCNDRNRIMIQKTIEMGHELGMQVIAEGVETGEQLELLRSIGCDSAQGYLFCRPIPAGEMVDWLETYRSKLEHPSPQRGELFHEYVMLRRRKK